MEEERQVRQQVVIDTSPELAFEALTAAGELREWFCDEAQTDVRPDGRYEVRWQHAYRVDAKFTAIDAPRHAAITWRGTGEPGETNVEFNVEPAGDGAGVTVTVVHDGFGPGEEWDKAFAESEKGWTTGLENLKSTLESGIDLRTARRPFMGILLDVLDAARAAREGIAVDKGIYLTGTVEGSAARAAGLGKGDVIVAIDGRETPGFAELSGVLQGHKLGDVIELELVRGQKRDKMPLTLGSRPRPDVGGTAAGLAQLLAGHCAETDTELRAAVEGLSDEEAGQSPGKDEWSVKQVLAHLIIVERDTQNFWATVSLAGWQDGGPHNPSVIPGRLAAVLSCNPSLQGLLARLTDYEAENVAFLRALPAETLAHKARFARLCEFVSFAANHTREHIEQINHIVRAVRAG